MSSIDELADEDWTRKWDEDNYLDFEYVDEEYMNKIIEENNMAIISWEQVAREQENTANKWRNKYSDLVLSNGYLLKMIDELVADLEEFGRDDASPLIADAKKVIKMAHNV